MFEFIASLIYSAGKSTEQPSIEPFCFFDIWAYEPKKPDCLLKMEG